jgi:tryptophan halogenase
VDWQAEAKSYFHPFGALGNGQAQYDFYQAWLRAREQTPQLQLQDFAACSVMAQKGKFFLPHQARKTPIGGANYALHVDAQRVAQYLADFAKVRGVKHTYGQVEQVIKASDDVITQLVLADGRTIEGDFFIDCSGFQARLIGAALDEEFVDWGHYLPCDKAVAVKTQPQIPTPPYTRATAQKYGWTWRIPLTNAVGHGYVYASRFCDDRTAKNTLVRHLETPRLAEPKIMSFRCGHRRQTWRGNCLALGLAAGFVEPLEATSIHLITRGLSFFLRYYPDKQCNPALIREFNRRMTTDFEEVRDFIMLHYAASSRRDSPFWQWWQTVELPDSLQQRIELFRAQGASRDGVDELFRASSWQSVFEGMGIRPDHACPRTANLSMELIQRELANAKHAIAGMVDLLPSHDDILQGQR